jgi:protein subunit release factor A
MKILVEIRAEQGGKDAKLLVEDMAGMYQKACQRSNFTCETNH